ncbi:ABC transporter ATP-binding protein [Diaminobutyricibacter tongyongensis]|uniref:ABC transporter ATP-binding protein n=1 Tax=Leifsonia tongyongensis TaxID=1268043 RepID=A0A6L9XTR9_9MICO|nr:ABC transporter ATP-binding protein [Diaminobutyricibacter tongyongensis]NEN04706.1 ABC transporter ATP-binding protein [Diaminobutyricibacter tongyongensis]
MDALTAENISSGYGRSPIVRDVSLSAPSGKITTIVGPNGAGKSTFAKTLAGILRPSTGRILVNGVDITRVPGHLIPRHGLSYVPQNDNVFRTLTVKENLEVGGYPSKGDPRERMLQVFRVFPDLQKAQDKKAGNLSGGQQNLLAMARALMAEPSVIVLDEPTAGLSPAYTDIVWTQIGRIAGEGTAVLVIEQNVERALTHAQFVHVLVAGTNHAHGPVEEIAKLDLAGIFLGQDRTNSSASTTSTISSINH